MWAFCIYDMVSSTTILEVSVNKSFFSKKKRNAGRECGQAAQEGDYQGEEVEQVLSWIRLLLRITPTSIVPV